MGTWIKETAIAFYLMEGGHYISKISKYPSSHNPAEQVANITGMRAWFTRADAPRGITISIIKDGIEPLPKPTNSPVANSISLPATPVAEKSTAVEAIAVDTLKRINKNGLLLIKSFEGLRLQAYQDAVGIWTIGYGTTRGVQPNMRISEAQAEQFLQEDLARFEKAIHEAVTVPVNDNQFSALVSFTYNVGSGALRSSTLLRLLNARTDLRKVSDEFPRWNRAGGQILAGLTRRRQAERALFLGEDFYNFL